ncbi:MAG: type II toxin-antitoxin system Phd/YefM family antitoxin [Brevundimonas sp.]|nr:MAG: type II toxin-antitoxin system Phd/YefM family antitoxin [Brevundimonas sp.]
MRIVTSREFNQDVSSAKRMARMEPVFVTDRGRPTHVLVSIDAYRRLSGQVESILDLLSEPDGSDAEEAEARSDAAWAGQAD